jgi:hypothetical protein
MTATRIKEGSRGRLILITMADIQNEWAAHLALKLPLDISNHLNILYLMKRQLFMVEIRQHPSNSTSLLQQ